ncbi:MAG: DoxX family protein [Phycisphaerae bacterium]|nr:DoxX family protein [Phycisphaerae bacterium]
MSMGQSLSGSIAPLFLRAVLAVTFVWAGLGKFMADFPVSGDAATRLAEWGVIAAPAAPPTPATPTEVKPEAPPAPTGTTPPPPLMALQTPPAQTTTVKRMYAIALGVHAAANPKPRDGGSTPMALLPADLGKGPWPVRLAWAASLTELIGGALIFLGLLTRFSGFSIAIVMLTAMWLTQIGPAMQSGNTIALLLPAHQAFDGEKWKDLLFQFSLFGSAMALACVGSGALAFDRALFRAKSAAKPPSGDQGSHRPL